MPTYCNCPNVLQSLPSSPYHLPIHLSIYPCIHLTMHLSIYLSMHPSTHLSMHLSIYPSMYVSINQSINLSPFSYHKYGGGGLQGTEWRREHLESGLKQVSILKKPILCGRFCNSWVLSWRKEVKFKYISKITLKNKFDIVNLYEHTDTNSK